MSEARTAPLPTGFLPRARKTLVMIASLRSLIQAAAAPVLLTTMLGLVIGFATIGVVGAV